MAQHSGKVLLAQRDDGAFDRSTANDRRQARLYSIRCNDQSRQFGGPLVNFEAALIGLVSQKSFAEEGINWRSPSIAYEH